MQSQDYRTNKKKPSFNNQLNMQKKKKKKKELPDYIASDYLVLD
jgi:hypothetical protein